MKFIKKKGKSLGIGLAMVGSLLVSSLQAGPVYLHSGESIVSWKLKPEAEVGTNVPALLNAGYDTSSWVDAVVPGTAFTSYVTAGLEKDPNFGDNIHNVDRAKYDRSFWYRTEFKVPADFDKALTWLNFNGVNRKAEIYLNGHLLGTRWIYAQRTVQYHGNSEERSAERTGSIGSHAANPVGKLRQSYLLVEWWLGLDALCAGTEYGYHG